MNSPQEDDTETDSDSVLGESAVPIRDAAVGTTTANSSVVRRSPRLPPSPANLFEAPGHAAENNNDTSLKSYVENENLVKPDNKMQYILMVARGVCEDIPAVEDITTVDPFHRAINAKLCSKLQLRMSKEQLVKEIKRRNPKRKTNAKNKKVNNLFALLQEEPLEDADDIEYIKSTAAAYIKTFNDALEEAAGEKVREAKMTKTDRLRWLCALEEFQELRVAYIQSQDVLTRSQLDSRNSDRAPKGFHELICQKCNDPEFVAQTRPILSLHSDFAESISCDKRDNFTFTPEKSKNIVAKYRSALEDICRRYNQSGAGSLQATQDEDGQYGDSFGHVDLDKIERDGKTDDRAGYLLHEPTDVLYAWDVFDKYQLIHFTTAKLRGVCAASSLTGASMTSYSARKRARSSDDSLGTNSVAELKMTESMVAIGDGLHEMNKNKLLDKIDKLKAEMFSVKKEMKKAKRSGDFDEEDAAMYRERLDELEAAINHRVNRLDIDEEKN